MKFLRALWLCLIAVAPAASFSQTVLINEIMYHPASTNLLEQWLELYNPGSNTVDLTGWRFSNGIQFSFPSNTVLTAGGYLVVAADRHTFTNKFPVVTNFVAGWAAPLEGHTIELDDNLGQNVNSVTFYNDGDWAVRVLGAVQYNHQGWEWFALHDGYGSSLELIDPQMPNSYAQNWGSNKNTNATPGRVNSIVLTNVAPFITEVAHFPIIPQPSDPVTISARILDEHTNGLTVTLNYRVDGAASFTSVPMFDDGAHGDGLAFDGIFAAILPAQPNATIVEFFLQARDLENNLRTYPAYVPPGNSRTANLLYQVDNQVYTGAQPIYRIIMRENERAELYALGGGCPDSDSDAAMNATWITLDNVVTDGTTTQLRYNTDVRNRGHGSRQANPHNYHVNIPSDRTWKKQSGINLNSQYTQAQILGSAIFRKLEVSMPDSRAVQVRVNGANLMVTGPGTMTNSFGSYAANEQYNNDFVKRSFPLDAHGNSYRGIRDAVLCDSSLNGVADFTWHGANYTDPNYALAYFKQNNFIQNDWSDLIDLFAVLNSQNGHLPANYVADMQQRVNVEEWMKYMAINTLLDNNETCPANGVGDDYALYRGTNDTHFLLLPYDMDTIMGQGNNCPAGGCSSSPHDGIFRMTPLAVMDKFMKTPQFAPIYFRILKNLAETAFSSAEMDPFLDQLLNSFVPQPTIDTMKSFNASHVAYCVSQIPLTLTASSTLPLNSGYPYTTTSTASLSGSANAIETLSVLVNGSAATYTAWQGAWTIGGVTLRPGINRVLIQALNTNSVEVARTNIDIWYDDASVATATINAGSNYWSAAGGPYLVSGAATIPAGTVVRVQAGASVYFGAGAKLTVNGQLLAEGSDSAHIRFTRQPGGGNWNGLDFINTTVESRLAYADFEFCAGSSTPDKSAQLHVNNSIVFIDHCTWPSTPAIEYISFNGSSFIVQNCTFPTFPGPSADEPLHGINGIPASGYGIFRDNYFGHTWGFNDTIDFTGGNRPSAILQIINNVFDGASDDCLDLDSTDAWIEGNIFMHVHRDPTRNDNPLDTGSAISGGVDTVGQNSDWTIINNIFYDVDHVFLNKGNSTTTGNGGGRVAFLYNTVIHVAKEYSGSTAGEIAAFDWSDDSIALPDPAIGSGMYAANNIIYDCTTLHHLYNAANHTVIMDNNILSVPWSGPGSGNQVIDPLLNLQALNGTAPTNVTVAQLRQAARLRPGSPAIGAGFGGLNLGGFQPHGIAIAGEPPGVTTSTSAKFTVGPVGTFNWGTTAPQPWGWTAFKWKLDNGSFSAEIPATNNLSPFTNLPSITLSNLSNGPHTLYVVGKNDAPPGYYQDNTFVYPPTAGIPARVTASRTWTVNTNLSHVMLNEVLAKNSKYLSNGPATPDLIEIYNPTLNPIDLGGMGLTDNASEPYKFTFPSPTVLPSGGFLVLYADSSVGGAFLHTGFGLKDTGDDLSLFDTPANGGMLIDSITFGIQVADFSLGRLADGNWGLCIPTFGSANTPLSLGDPRDLKINEWLADAQFAANHDFIELYNPDPVPVLLGGLYLSDAAGAPGRSLIPPLSFIAANGLSSFIADGDPQQGADHLNFHLSPDVGIILLSAPDLTLIDAIAYGPQQTDISQGRSPNGSDTLTSFAQPTDGSPNPGPRGGVSSVTNITQNVVHLLTVSGSSWRYNATGVDLGTAWQATGYADNTWSNGFGLFGYETVPSEYSPYTFQTYIPPTTSNSTLITAYYRTHFQWSNALSGYQLIATNYIDDGVLIYLNGSFAGGFRLSPGATYSTLAANQGSEGTPDILNFPNPPINGDNVIAVEVHQSGNASSDDVFGMNLVAIAFVTNIISSTTGFTPVILNEVLADNQTLTNSDGRTADWIELYNPATNSVDLADCSLSDDPNNARKWVFPSNYTIAAKAYLVIYCDPDRGISRTNTGFGLDASGETIYFFEKPANGGGLLDSLRFGIQTPDFAIGRIPTGTGNWTLTVPTRGAGNAAASLANISNLRVNEWMANPAGGDEDWFEIYNAGSGPVALGGLFLTDDLADRTQSPIPPLSFIGSGGNAFVQFIADGHPDKGANHVNFKLNNGGEQIGIYSPSGTLINGITFGSQVKGISQGRFPDGSGTIVSFTTASPAESNFLPIPQVAVNELLSHTDPPFEDALELYNPTLTPTNITGWFLSNSKLNLKKYRITNNITLGANGYAVFYENQFGNTNSATAFTFNSAHGDEAILSAADAGGNLTGYRTKLKFGAAENGVSFGRYQTSIGFDFTAMSQHTFGMDNPADVVQFRTGTGATNAYPKVGPIVINEIMYHPVGGPATNLVEDPAEEFIELRNMTGSSVPLYDPAYPSNTWKFAEAVEFQFPTNITLGADAYLLVVGFNPGIDAGALASFRSKYGVSNTVPILGPWKGRLDNGGESIELYKPDAVQLPPHPDAGFVPYILVDRVNYQSVAPWTTNANGTGASLQRIVSSNYGNDPVNWTSGSPTAGRTNAFNSADTDGDGMPDAWEIANGFDRLDPSDAMKDADNDGFTNLDEYRAGTNPHDANSNLRITSQVHNQTNFVLQFNAIAGKSYYVAYRTNMSVGGWTILSNVPPPGVSGPITITDPGVVGTATRVYQVRLPLP